MADAPVRITYRPGSPHRIDGPVVVVDADGNEIPPPPSKVPGIIRLCSCGLSQNKPFCDSSHKQLTTPAAPPPPSDQPG
jgi:CDGSH-type Zn-finger protein